MKLVLATRNRAKVMEMTSILQHLDLQIFSALDFQTLPEVVEDGETFRDNAVKKAEAVCAFVNLPSLADDSGLEIEALGGRPGVQSSRFAGSHGDDRKNIEMVLELLADVPPERRQARFRCVIAMAFPGSPTHTVEGTCEGTIALESRGSAGFGYDPIFLVPAYGKTFGELGNEVKNRVSHRARALAAARQFLQKMSVAS
jgi:XTP/dITP diphosphohydrolase